MKINTCLLLCSYLIVSGNLLAEDSREQKVQNYINAYNGNYDMDRISKDATTYGVSASEIQKAMDAAKQNSNKPAEVPPVATTPEPSASGSKTETASSNSQQAMDNLKQIWANPTPILGETKVLDDKLKNKTDPLSQEQIAYLETLKARWNSKGLQISDHAKKLMAEEFILESKQIASMSPDQFSAWANYQATVPTQAYINSNGTWVSNPNYDPCYEIRTNTNGANTPENMKKCSALKSETIINSQQLGSNLDYIKLQKESAIEMLIKGADQLKMGKISKDQFVEISKYAAEVAKYSGKVTASLSSAP